MAKSIPASDALASLEFPAKGLDVSCEFERQPPLTTPRGANVRAYEPSQMRGRGGARPGLVQYIASTVNGVHLIQHLDLIVDPQAAALPDYDPPGPNSVTGGANPAGGGNGPAPGTQYDPTEAARNDSGRIVRFGGSGIQPTRRRKNSAKIAFVQATGATRNSTANTLAFVSPVTIGGLLVAAVAVLPNTQTATTAALTDDQGNSWTQIGGYVSIVSAGVETTLSLWYARASATGVLNVTATGSAGTFSVNLAILEYSGASVTPLDGTNSNLVISPASGAVTTGAVSGSQDAELLVGVFQYQSTSPGLTTPSAGFTTRVDLAGMVVIERNPVPSGGGAATATQAGTAGNFADYGAVGATFLPA